MTIYQEGHGFGKLKESNTRNGKEDRRAAKAGVDNYAGRTWDSQAHHGCLSLGSLPQRPREPEQREGARKLLSARPWGQGEPRSQQPPV